MNLGIGSYTYGWATGAYGFSDPAGPRPARFMSATELVDRAVELDVPYVQICYRPALHELSAGDLKHLRRYAETRGKHLEIGTSGCVAEVLTAYAEVAATLNARLVRTIFPNASPGLVSERRVLESVLPAFEAHGIVLAIENHEDCSVHQLAGLIREVESECLGVCMDTVNSLGRGEGTQEVVDSLLPYARTLHVKDFATRRRASGMGFEVTGAPAGTGRLDVPWLLSCAASADPEMSVVLEQWSDFGDSIEASMADQERDAVDGIAYLKSLAGTGDHCHQC